jgi:hypothetical protein
MKSRSWMIAILCVVVSAMLNAPALAASAEPSTEVPANVKYSAGKDVNFEEMLIQGQLKRPDVSVITGNVKEGADGLLRLRENFLDRVTSDAGEESME